MLYSPSTNGFYLTEIHGNNIPNDVVEITQNQHSQLLEAQSQGKIIQPDENGFPVAVDRPAYSPTWEDIRQERNIRLSNSDWTQLADAPLTVNQKTAWTVYRQSLRDIPENFQTPEVVVWPVVPQ